MKKIITTIVAASLLLASFAGCSSKPTAADTSSAAASNVSSTAADTSSSNLIKLVVGASPTPHAIILNFAKDILAKQGIDLQVVEFTDYVQPNLALESKDLDANYFQHQPYLDDFNKEHSTHIVSVCAPHYEPFGIYPGKTKSLDALKDGASVAVPNDTTNEARALLLLQAKGLIKLKADAGLGATKKDITENDKHLKITEIEAAQLPRSIQDVDIAAINGNYAVQAGLSASKDALAVEAADSDAATTYANIVAVREGDENRPEIQALVKVLKSKEVKDFITQKFDGAVVPTV